MPAVCEWVDKLSHRFQGRLIRCLHAILTGNEVHFAIGSQIIYTCSQRSVRVCTMCTTIHEELNEYMRVRVNVTCVMSSAVHIACVWRALSLDCAVQRVMYQCNIMSIGVIMHKQIHFNF